MCEAYSLYILETLIQSNGSMPVNSLWSCISARFQKNAEFISVIGNTISDFEEFLLKQTSLFRIANHIVSLLDSTRVCLGDNVPIVERRRSAYSKEALSSHSGSSSHSGNGCSDFESDTAAVKFFQAHLLKRQEKWVPIKSLAGHLSQASAKVRTAVGPQSDFIHFLNRHPLVFEVQGELASLRDDFRNACFMASSSNAILCLNSKRKRKERPQSMRISNLVIKKNSFSVPTVSDYLNVQAPLSHKPNYIVPSSVANFTSTSYGNTVALSGSEYKSVMWLRQMVVKHSPKAKVSSIMQELINAAESIRNTIGLTQIELVEFLYKHGSIFTFNESSGCVDLCSTRNINLLIMGSRPHNENSFSLIRQRGCVFCVTKLWGIIDLGFHEHVFFDRSLFKHVTDLTKHFKIIFLKMLIYDHQFVAIFAQQAGHSGQN
ncbi:unnamed protein product [Protopolystoma xenopodis]|uniref:Egal-1 winged helix domain-containing protein n=1 Tax=Protopolystoma xenopodis TaxID=117903 RepID=A0A3S5ANM5_9PLAT|nr:unnamed protein product [Protopolystoma xenopodis]